MNKLWDKFLLGLSCCAFMLAEGTDPSNITTLLLAVICSAIFQIKPSSAVAYLSVIAYSSLCIFSKEALILAPLVLYDAFCTKFYPAMVLTFIGHRRTCKYIHSGKRHLPACRSFFGKLHNFKPQRSERKADKDAHKYS